MTITRYFKSAWRSLLKQPLLSAISVGGTALAIFLIMIIVMIDEVKTAPFSPESNRDRWLVQLFGSIGNKEWNSTPDLNSSNGPLSYNTIRRTFYEMEVPEAIAVFTGGSVQSRLSVKGKTPLGAKRKDTDDGFWKVMDFDFISGKGYDRSDVDASAKSVVISESLAKRLFDTTDCIGRDLSIDFVDFRVCGVVRDVSSLASYADADLWVPLTSTSTGNFVWCEHMGSFSVIILAKSRNDFPAIRDEYKKVWSRFNDEIKEGGWIFFDRERPYDQFTAVNTKGANVSPDMASVKRHNFVVYAILLLIPAINLSSMTQSRLRHRREEIGVRRVFGATRFRIMADIFFESLIITVIAGILGLFLSWLFLLLGGEQVLSAGVEVSGLRTEMVLNFRTFGIALGFCFLLNLLSASVPSYQASKTKIVNALSGK